MGTIEKSNFVVGFVIILCQMVGMQRVIDGPCTVESTGLPGVCRLLLECQQIRDEIIKTQRLPQTCGFQGTHPIVCCPINEKKRKPGVTSNITSLSSECTLPDGTEAFCVSIHDCLVLLHMLDPPTLRNRTCGPENQNRRDPYVCCEKHLIKYRTSTTPRTVPVESLCGFQNISSMILGGGPSNEEGFPWLAKIFRRDRQGELPFACSGTLISTKVVLTAAHCLVSKSLDDAQGELYSVSLGEHCKPYDCLLNKKMVRISSFIVHPEYVVGAKNHDNDIGLIILRNEVKFTSYIWPICLLENQVDESQFYVAGFDTTEFGGYFSLLGAVSNVKLAPYSWGQCVQNYRTLRVKITRRQICAGGTDACRRDSGGPLMVVRNETRWYVAGVASFGVSCERQGWPGIYAYVPKYIKWIRETIPQ